MWKDLETSQICCSNANTALLNRRNRLEGGGKGEQGRMWDIFSGAITTTKKEDGHPLVGGGGEWHQAPQG